MKTVARDMAGQPASRRISRIASARRSLAALRLLVATPLSFGLLAGAALAQPTSISLSSLTPNPVVADHNNTVTATVTTDPATPGETIMLSSSDQSELSPPTGVQMTDN